MICFSIVLLLQWRPQQVPAACEHRPGSRFRAAVEEDGLIWTADLNAALARARKRGQRVLVSVEAITDVNCLVNKRNVFTKPEVKKALAPYVLVVLYIDAIPDRYYLTEPQQEEQGRDGRANSEFIQRAFNTMQEPLYVTLDPKNDGAFDIVEIYEEAMIRNRAEFIRFLRDSRREKLPWPFRVGR